MTALWIACAAIWVAALIVFVADALAAKRIVERARGLYPSTLVQKLRAAPSDVKRTVTSLGRLPPLGRRVAVVMLSLANALGSYRSVALRFRSLFG